MRAHAPLVALLISLTATAWASGNRAPEIEGYWEFQGTADGELLPPPWICLHFSAEGQLSAVVERRRFPIAEFWFDENGLTLEMLGAVHRPWVHHNVPIMIRGDDLLEFGPEFLARDGQMLVFRRRPDAASCRSVPPGDGKRKARRRGKPVAP